MDRQSFSVGIKNQMLPNYVNLNMAMKQKIVNQGNDANALYLWAIMQDMSTSYFIRYKETNNFKPVVSHKYEHLAREWLEWLSFSENISIKHMSNGKEKRLSPRQLPIDGFCQQTKTVYQLHGCYWHGHLCHLN